MWSVNGFINDLPHYLTGELQKPVLTSNRNTNWKCFNIHVVLIVTLSYSKFESIQLQHEESAEKSNESGNMLFILYVLRRFTYRSLALTFRDKTNVTKMRLNWIFS